MEGVSALLARCPAPGLAGGLGVTACAAAGVLLYRMARRMKPSHTVVNCWFCSLDTVVPYGNRNCWDCPHCEQYNGFQENGDYNKPIPAQYLEHLNHVVGSAPAHQAPWAPPQQWVSSRTLLCRRCSQHQATKIRQLAAFTPRDEGRYDEEVEVYQHHLEQVYKLCRPCQAAVEHYLKHQNRQLRALLLSHQVQRRRDADHSHVQSFCSFAVKSPVQVIVLRALAFLACAFLLTTLLCGTGDPFAPGPALPLALPPGGNGSSPAPDNGTETWRQLLGLLPATATEKLRVAWAFGQHHQVAVVALGLLTCLLAMLLAGRLRLRRIDAFSSGLWALLLGLYLAEQQLQAASPGWLDTLKLSATALCCLVGFTAAVATRKATGTRRFRPRRYFPGDATGIFPVSPGLAVPCPGILGAPPPSLFIPAPPGFVPLASRPLFRSARRPSPSSLPSHLSRALSLGTIPSPTHADSGCLFSGSRPPSRVARSGQLLLSDCFSLLASSCPAAPLPSPAPSVAGSLASSSGSLRRRRPLISPARLNLQGQKLLLFPSPPGEAPHSPSSSEDSPASSRLTPLEPSPAPQRSPPRDSKLTVDVSAVPDGGACSNRPIKKEDDSSHASTCMVDTTTQGCSEDAAAWRGHISPSLIRGLLAVSLAANALFTSAYLYQSLR